MTDIVTGSLVKHTSLGVGKVVAVEPTAIHVFFPQGERRAAVKLRWPAASPLVTREGVEPDAWLAGLSSFALDPKSGRYELGDGFVTQEAALAEFLATFPQGFADPAYLGEAKAKGARAPRWRAAAAAWAEAFPKGEGERLLAKGSVREVVKRALSAVAPLAALRGTLDVEALEATLAPRDEVAAFLAAAFEAAQGAPARAKHEALFAATEALGVARDQAWTVATLFPFLADPAQHVVVAPKTTAAAGARLGRDLRWQAAPSWPTYYALRTWSKGLLEALAVHGARDYVDVEAFLHLAGTPPSRRKR